MRRTPIPEVDLAELAKVTAENRVQRLAFIDQHVAWLKRTPNSVWSAQQKTVVDQHPKKPA